MTSDKPDYAPGELVTLSGEGWKSGESVHIYVNDDQGQTWERSVHVTADENGRIRDSFNLPDWFVATYSVRATGASGAVATTSFTDGNVQVRLAGGPTSGSIAWAKFNGNSTCSGTSNESGSTTAGTSFTVIKGADAGQSLRLTAPSVSGYTFSGWSGAVTSSSSVVCVPGSASNQNVTATYALSGGGGGGDAQAPQNASISINGGAAWTNSASVSLALSATDNVGVASYRLATSQAALDSATAVAVSPAAANLSLSNVAFTLSSGDGAAKVAWVRFCDAQSNCTDASDTIGLDTVKPVITGSTGAYVPGTWTNQNVVVSFSCTDNQGTANSGVASSTVAGATLSASGADQQVTNSGTCTDNAGNKADSATVSDIDIDKDAPLLNVSGAASGTFNVCSIPSRPSFDPSDALSGLASWSDSWTTPSSASGVGTYTYNASAADNATNQASEQRTYSVTYGASYGGVLQPVNANGSSRFKLGSTVPVKFQLLCGTTPISNAVANLNVKLADNQPDAGEDEAISTAASTSGNLFRYDAASQQYVFNLSTKSGYTNPSGSKVSFSQGTWTLSIILDDGTHRNVNVQLVK